jgi:CHAD domain-containing protein
MALSPSGKWVDIRPDDTVHHAARMSLEARLMAVVHFLPRAAFHSDQDIEHVHRLRVGTRRAMAALELYRDLLPRKRARWITKQLKKVRRAAGEARDLDVLAERFQREYGERAAGIVEYIAQERTSVQPEITRIAKRFRRKEKFLRRTADLLEAIAQKGKRCSSAGCTKFRDWAAQQLSADAEQFLASVPDAAGDMGALHQFRIRAKAIRYSIELLASAFDSELRDSHYRTIEELQERLGQINDHVTARERLRDWAADVREDELQDLFCALAEEEVAQLTSELAAWREWWTADRVDTLRRGLLIRP